jgi:hypothetical protein
VLAGIEIRRAIAFCRGLCTFRRLDRDHHAGRRPRAQGQSAGSRAGLDTHALVHWRLVCDLARHRVTLKDHAALLRQDHQLDRLLRRHIDLEKLTGLEEHILRPRMRRLGSIRRNRSTEHRGRGLAGVAARFGLNDRTRDPCVSPGRGVVLAGDARRAVLRVWVRVRASLPAAPRQ